MACNTRKTNSHTSSPFQDYTAKLSDFGLAKDGPEGEETHVVTRILGTQGYAAPEYLRTGNPNSVQASFLSKT